MLSCPSYSLPQQAVRGIAASPQANQRRQDEVTANIHAILNGVSADQQVLWFFSKNIS